jgi:hypothetical protein
MGYATRVTSMCPTCRTMTNQDALALGHIQVVESVHDACAPVTHYTCRCTSCDTRWAVIEVYDESGERPSEWNWTRIDDVAVRD